MAPLSSIASKVKAFFRTDNEPAPTEQPNPTATAKTTADAIALESTSQPETTAQADNASSNVAAEAATAQPSVPELPRPTGVCGLLSLPSELVAAVVEECDLPSRIMLRRTCRALRDSLRDVAPNISELGAVDKFEYLAAHVRSLPYSWPCFHCFRGHKYHFHDSPYKFPGAEPLSAATNCPRGSEKLREHGEVGDGFYRFSHRHVQVALKYTRFGLGLQQWLNAENSAAFLRIMQAREIPVKSPKRPGRLDIKCRVHPRIVEGRFLLKVTWT